MIVAKTWFQSKLSIFQRGKPFLETIISLQNKNCTVLFWTKDDKENSESNSENVGIWQLVLGTLKKIKSDRCAYVN